MKSFLLVLTGYFLTLNAVYAGAGDPAAGEQKSQSCQACHGPDGNSPTPNFPNLAGQYQTYLLQALRDYKSGARKNAIMAGLAAPLSDQDMKDLSAYYSNQQGLSSASPDY